jgi:hypothetical protein
MDHLGFLQIELGKFLRLGGGRAWTPEDRKDWIVAVREELQSYPFALVVDALRDARKRVSWPNELVPWIVKLIDAKVDKLKIEEQRLSRLAEIART